jgi:hypothetical protein
MITEGTETGSESWCKIQIMLKCNHMALLAILTTILSLYFSK